MIGLSPGFLFDMDGVLIDSREFHWHSWERILKEGFVPHFNHDTFLKWFGTSNETFLKTLLPTSTVEQRKEIAQKKEEYFRTLCKGNLKLLPGMHDFLESLSIKKTPRIIASSAPRINLDFFLKETVLGEYFDLFISGEEVERGKPAPDVFIHAAEKLGLPSHQCIVLEDAPVGLQAGNAAGSFVVALATTNAIENLKPCHVLYHSPKDLKLNTLNTLWKNWYSKFETQSI